MIKYLALALEFSPFAVNDYHLNFSLIFMQDFGKIESCD